MSTSFTRDRLTLVLYATLVAFGFAIATLGPSVPLLRSDLGVSRTVAGLHFTAGALGSVFVGVAGRRLVVRIGRAAVLRSGLLGLVIGPLGLVLGQSARWTIAGTFAAGLAANLVFLVVNGVLADHHGPRRSTALAEANAIAGAVFMLPGLLVGAFAAVGISWRIAFLVPVLVALVLLRPTSRLALPETPPPTDDTSGRFLAGFGAAVAALTLSVAIEWSMAGWAAEHLVGVGAAPGMAAAGAAIFYGAVLAGRLAVVPLTRRYAEGPLLFASLAVTAAGALIFWLGSSPALVLAGVVLGGVGVSYQFPLLASVLFALAPGRTDAASARISLVGGLAVMTAPVTLGAWADARGLEEALSGVVFLVAALAVALAFVLWAARRPPDRLPA
ncbi:MAG: MFS transporter [Acidimicrobiia bacterium]|nr:MAG: MFS transporter [Acidimicrobiia bacterium]